MNRLKFLNRRGYGRAKLIGCAVVSCTWGGTGIARHSGFIKNRAEPKSKKSGLPEQDSTLSLLQVAQAQEEIKPEGISLRLFGSKITVSKLNSTGT